MYLLKFLSIKVNDLLAINLNVKRYIRVYQKIKVSLNSDDILINKFLFANINLGVKKKTLISMYQKIEFMCWSYDMISLQRKVVVINGTNKIFTNNWSS